MWSTGSQLSVQYTLKRQRTSQVIAWTEMSNWDFRRGKTTLDKPKSWAMAKRLQFKLSFALPNKASMHERTVI